MLVSEDTEFDPHIVVVHDRVLATAKVTEPPLLVVKVQSPSTALIDRNAKRAAYERFGVPFYWLVVPDPVDPSMTVLELTGSHYDHVATVTGGDIYETDRPFPVRVQPSALVARLPGSTAVSVTPGLCAVGHAR